MKTRSNIAKAALMIAIAATGIVLSSFTGTKKTTAIKNYEEYNKVREFVHNNICNPIREKEGSKVNADAFSRCPSGYHSKIAGHIDSVKVDQFTYGKVNLYKGCAAKYVCDFKVCVSKNIAEVKTKEMTEYVSVNIFLEMGNAKPSPQVKHEKSIDIKG